MILETEDKEALENCRDHEKDGGVAFLADILCKIVAYLEEKEDREPNWTALGLKRSPLQVINSE